MARPENEPKCPECGYSVYSEEHKRGIGLHDGSFVYVEPEPVRTLTIREDELDAIVAAKVAEALAAEQPKDHNCPICGGAFDTAMRLGSHVKKAHGMTLAEARKAATPSGA